MWTILLLGCGDDVIVKGTPAVSPTWPTAHLVEPGDVPDGALWVDAREAPDFAAGHIEGAAQANWRELAAFDEDGIWGPTERESAAALLADRGLDGSEGPIVVYDDWGSGYYGGDGYLYWTLRYLGAPDVRVLHGGWSAWIAAGGESETATPEPGDFEAGEEIDVLATTEEVARASEDGSALLLDVRSQEEWDAGHVPGAVFLAWDDLLDDGALLAPEEISARLAAVGLDDPAEPVITYCAGGIRAGQTFWVLELMGFTAVQDYVGSWSAWSASGGPVEVD